MPTEIETLKPCPFCSGPAAICNREMAGCTYIACDDCGASCEDGSLEIAAARWNRRALDSPIGEQGVGVRALEWWSTDNGDIIADSIVGRYRLGKVTANSNYRLETPSGLVEKFAPDYYWPENEAKAAAQADFTRRILSALSPERKEPPDAKAAAWELARKFYGIAPAPERKEPVAWARRFEGRWLYTRITRVAEIWREQGCEVQPLYATPGQPT